MKLPSTPVTELGLALSNLRFAAPVLIDKMRPGGEPVIAVTDKGTILVSSHPGDTHLFLGGKSPVDPNVPLSFSGQNMLWRSTDGGKTFAYVGLPIINAGPRDAAYGRSDPDFAIDVEGNIFLVSLYIPFLAMSRSSDDGMTWTGLPVSEILPFPANDRPWLAARGANEVWIASHGSVWKSVPGSLGLAYAPARNAFEGPGWNLNVDPKDGTLYMASGSTLRVSTDGGATFANAKALPDRARTPYTNMPEPAIDSDGNVYAAYFRGGALYYAAWTPRGEKLLGEHQVTDLNGTHLWPWIVAGDRGRIGIAWLGSDTAQSTGTEADWYLYAAVIEDADTAAPVYHVARATAQPIHRGTICQDGVGCVGTGDRRLGDFLTAAFDAAGNLLIASAATRTGDASADDGVISHPLLVRQETGPTLRVPVN